MLESVINQLSNSYVIFKVSSHMLKNSEFNATIPIREFLRDESIFNFWTLSDGSLEYLECIIIYNNEKHVRKVRVGFPPNKREARFWIYGLNDFVSENNEVLMSKAGDNLVVIPLNQNNFSSNISDLISQAKLDDEGIAEYKKLKGSQAYAVWCFVNGRWIFFPKPQSISRLLSKLPS